VTTSSPRLARLAQGAARDTVSQDPREQEERCELCGTRIDHEHRHVADVQARTLLCACRGCAILLGRPGAGGAHYRLVPERRLVLRALVLDDQRWAALQVPVDLAFFFRSSTAGRVVALYPSPVGATESQLALEAWDDLQAANPVVAELEPDVEALLVRGAGAARECFIVPISDCYELVALIRSRWTGLAGGSEITAEVAQFFDTLRARGEEVR
jgi:hypothetical protein